MNNVPLDRGGEAPAQRALLGLHRIGGAHDLPDPPDRPFSLEDHRHTRAGRHEASKALEKWLVPMDLIESFSLSLPQRRHLQPPDYQPFRLKSPDHLADEPPGDSIRLRSEERRVGK